MHEAMISFKGRVYLKSQDVVVRNRQDIPLDIRGAQTLHISTSRYMTTRIICAANNCMLSSSKYTLHIFMYINASLHLGCYSVGTVEPSLENCAVDSAIITQSTLLPYTEGKGRLAF